MKKYNALRYFQGEQEYYMTVMPFCVINSISHALIYGENEYGYQRALNPTHYKKIYKSIVKSNELISPTSIVLGVNKSELNDYVEHEKDNIYNLNLKGNNKIFRIIDGQHRLKGLEMATADRRELLEYNLSIIIMVIDDNKRRTEVRVFNDINSKSKPLKMDLTILALYKYDILEKVREFDIKEHVAIKVAHILNEGNFGRPIWKNAIKLDINNTNSIGIIGFKTFYESIQSICTSLVNDDATINKDSLDEIFDIVDEKAKKIAGELLNPCWEIVYNKWEKCFKNSIEISNYEDIETFFDRDYYIQKTMGAKAINWLIFDCLKESNGVIHDTISRFGKRIEKSLLSSNDWEVGGKLSGLSSEAGFKKIKDLI